MIERLAPESTKAVGAAGLSSQIREWLVARPFTKAVTVLAGGTAAAQFAAVLASPILTRLYPVSAFGHLQAYISFVNLGVIIATLRFEVASLLPTDEDTAIHVQCLALLSTVFVTTLAAVIVALVQSAFVTALPRSAMWLIPLGIGGAGLLQVATFDGLRHKSFPSVARSKFVQVATQLLVQVAGAPSGLAGFALVGGDVVGRFAGAGVLVRNAYRRARSAATLSREMLFGVARRYKDFATISTGAALLNTGGFALPPLLIGYAYGAQALGFYALVDRIMGAPVVLVGQSVSQVYAAEASRAIAESPSQVLTLFDRAFVRLAKLGAVGAVIIFPLAPWLFAKIFGATWREAGIYAQLLVARQFAAFAVWPLSQTLNIIEDQRSQLWWDAARTTLTVIAIVVPSRVGMGPRVAITAYSAVMFVGYALYAVLCRSVLKKRIATAAGGAV